MSRKNKIYFLAVFLAVLSIASILFAVYSRRLNTLEIQEIEASLRVFNKTGVDLNNTALTFGNILPGSSVERGFTIQNQYNFPIKAVVKSEGEISKFLFYDKEVYIAPNETERVGVSVRIPQDESFGSYSGKLIVYIKKDI